MNEDEEDHRRPVIEKLYLPNGRPYHAHYSRNYDLSKPPPRLRSFIPDDVRPSGEDNGNGARKLLESCAGQIVNYVKPEYPTEINVKSSDPFLEAIHSDKLQQIPLKSQLATVKALQPIHSTAKRQLVKALYNRLRLNDSSLLRFRLNSEEIDDELVIYLSKALEKNQFLQVMMSYTC